MEIEYASTSTSFRSCITLSSVSQRYRSILSVFCYLLLMVITSGQQPYRCPIIVLSIDHSSDNNNGAYFNFEISTGDNILGHTDWSYSNYYIFNSRTNETTLCVLWRYSTGGSHSAHGRKDVGFYGNGQWEIGDVLYFINVDVFCNNTQYFNKQNNIVFWEYESISSTEFSSDWKKDSTEWTEGGTGIPRLMIHGSNGYIYLQDATNTKGYYQIQLEFHLVQSGNRLDSGEYALVKYSIDDSVHFVTLQSYSQSELGQTSIELPAECNDNDGIRIRFQNNGTDYWGDIFYIQYFMRLTGTLLPTGDCSVSVTSVDHVSNIMGKYFNFDNEIIDEMLNSTDWNSYTFYNVYNSRTEQNYTIIIWRYNNGGSTGTAHGRKHPLDTAQEDDWQIGDLMIFNHYSCEPTKNPTFDPTMDPTKSPTDDPTHVPTQTPTLNPSIVPAMTYLPSFVPTIYPSNNPTYIPSYLPTLNPPTNLSATSVITSSSPTKYPTHTASTNPIPAPTDSPTLNPSIIPSVLPTAMPSIIPTYSPSFVPTMYPSNNPTYIPSYLPTLNPSTNPSATSVITSSSPTKYPTHTPTDSPTLNPSIIPSVLPTDTRSSKTEIPTISPTQISTLSSREISSQNTTYPLNPLNTLSEATRTWETTDVDWVSDNNPWREYEYQQELDHLAQLYQMAGGGFMVLFTSLTILSWIDAGYVRINDYFKVGGIISMMLQTLDMMSDCFFAVELSIQSKVRSDIEYTYIFYGSVLFIIFPALIALFQLYKHVRKYWMDNDFVRSWLSKYTTILLLLSVVTGSSFAAVSLLNSYIFQIELFDMGLTKKERTAFNTRRVYSIVLFENMPQLALQTYYLYLEGAVNNPITVSSIAFSIVSILVSILSMTVTKAINYTQGYVVISVNVTGDCVEANASKCRTMNSKLKKRIGTLIGVDPSMIEVMKPIHIANGFEVSFHVYVNRNRRNSQSNYDHILKESIDNGKLGNAFQNAWKLCNVPKISNISTDIISSKKEIKIKINVSQLYHSTAQTTPTTTGSTPTTDPII